MQRFILGFTIIEIMITLLVAAILLMVTPPMFCTAFQTSRSSALNNDFLASLKLARSEAIKRSSPVTVCSAADSNQTSCSDTGDWSNGWLVFTDPNGDGIVANAAERIKIHGIPESGSTITGAPRVTYTSSGFSQTGATTFTLTTSACGVDNARTVSLSNTGRTTSH